MVQAAAYYYHGLILDEGNTEKSHRMAVAALQSAEELLKESKDVAEAFHAAPPVSRQRAIHPSLNFFTCCDVSFKLEALLVLGCAEALLFADR